MLFRSICEEVIRQHPQAAALHPDSINCIRVATFVKDGEPLVIYAACKAGTGGMAFDNMGRGGITMRFDLDTGKIAGQGHDEELKKYDRHPTTGIELKGYQMPMHEEVKALALKAAGYTVYELSRRAQGVEGLHHLVADITREELVDAAIGEVLRQEGHIDVVVNNAGFGISGAIEFTKTEDAKRLFDADFFGMVNVNRAVIPHMRQAGAGRIVNLSSVAAAAPIPFQAYYSAAKAAVNSYTMALANELRPYGVTVCAVQPGDIHTGFTAAREKTIDGDDVYGGRISRSVARMEHDEQTGMDPAKAGAFIAKVAMKRRVKPIYTIRFDYQFLALLTRILPYRFLNWLIGVIYGK